MSIEDGFAAFRRVAGRELDKLREENAALKTALDHQMNYQRELRADKDRLDWMQEMKLTILHHNGKVFGRGVNPPCTRAAIDAAMGEGKQ